MDQSIDVRRAQANAKNVEAALNLQLQRSIEQYENTDESATIISTEDDNHYERDRPSTRSAVKVSFVRIYFSLSSKIF